MKPRITIASPFRFESDLRWLQFNAGMIGFACGVALSATLFAILFLKFGGLGA